MRRIGTNSSPCTTVPHGKRKGVAGRPGVMEYPQKVGSLGRRIQWMGSRPSTDFFRVVTLLRDGRLLFL